MANREHNRQQQQHNEWPEHLPDYDLFGCTLRATTATWHISVFVFYSESTSIFYYFATTLCFFHLLQNNK